jgi:hypothetical protein
MPSGIRPHDPNEDSMSTQNLRKWNVTKYAVCTDTQLYNNTYIIRWALRHFVIFQCSTRWNEVGTNFNTVNPHYRLSLWSSGQSFWLQIQRSRVLFQALQDCLRSRGVWNGVHSASWGQLSSYLIEKGAAPVKKTEINGRGNSLRWPRNALYLQKLALTSLTSGGSSVGIVRLRAKATEFSFSLNRHYNGLILGGINADVRYNRVKGLFTYVYRRIRTMQAITQKHTMWLYKGFYIGVIFHFK